MLTVPAVVTEPAPRIPAQQGLCCCYSLLCCLFAFLFSVMLTASSKNILVTLKDKIGNLILFQIHINRKQKSILLQHDCPIQHQQHYSDNKWITISLEKGQSHNSFFFLVIPALNVLLTFCVTPQQKNQLGSNKVHYQV